MSEMQPINFERDYLRVFAAQNLRCSVLGLQPIPDVEQLLNTAEEALPRTTLLEDRFRAIAAKTGMNKARITRAWRAGIYTAERYNRSIGREPLERQFSAENTLELADVLGGMRAIEQGQITLSDLGQPGWDLYGSIINDRLSELNDSRVKLLPWDTAIHPRLRSTSGKDARKQAAADLQARYDAARHGTQELLF